MITLLHGDNVLGSRAALVNLKQKAVGKDIRELDGKNLDALALSQALESGSLFGHDVVVIIERLLATLGKKKKSSDPLLKILTDNASSLDIILWEEKEVGKTVVDSLGKGLQVQLFKVPSSLFQFLDSVSPRTVPQSLQLLEKTLEHEAIELVYYLLVKRVRQLLVITSGGKLDSVSPWQHGRLTSQARGFTMKQLESLYLGFLEDEYALKSGNSPFGLRELLEQRLMKLVKS